MKLTQSIIIRVKHDFVAKSQLIVVLMYMINDYKTILILNGFLCDASNIHAVYFVYQPQLM